MGPELLFLVGIIVAHGALAAGWVSQEGSRVANSGNHLRPVTGRDTALRGSTGVAGHDRHTHRRTASAAAVNAATITMDGLTTSNEPVPFARPSPRA